MRKRKKAGRVGCASADAAQSLSQTSQKCRKKSSSETGLPLMQMRSLTSTRCGEVYLCAAPQRLLHSVICCTPRDYRRYYSPVFSPCARKIDSVNAHVDPFPFVPAT